MDNNYREIEEKWQNVWKKNNVYKVENDSAKKKFYVLDMFPYPSGAGLHVGHPLGYIASDIYSRYKRLKGFNVLHPMGFDSFGLPAEQYALETGCHPADTTEKNISVFKSQLEKIGFCYDWSREIRTSDPLYYRWTQWIFLELFNSYFCNTQQKALPISELINKYETKGAVPKNGLFKEGVHFTADEWNGYPVEKQAEIIMNRRLVYSAYGEVNWCEALGTVLANDEVINGFSERGGHPVVKKKMKQWFLRTSVYADRLLAGLEKVDFSESMKEMQRNWIGKSIGAEIIFSIENLDKAIRVFTTRPETIFGVDFLVLAPEHPLVASITSAVQKESVEKYIDYVKTRSDRERMSEVKQVTGAFTGSYAVHPISKKKIPVWISEYVLQGYGTGAIMAVPCGDQRDFNFAKHFKIKITNILGDNFNNEEANPSYNSILHNSDFLNGLSMKEGAQKIFEYILTSGIGSRKINYKMRDAGFSRQRYWGEPFPIIWMHDIAVPLDESDLPVLLPHVENYKPGPNGQGPLANETEWVNSFSSSAKRETSTMPGYAGSSWYFLRYMDPHNNREFCSRKASDYWNQVDVYVGGTEHAVGHLLYSRMWTKVLYDLGLIGFDEPFKRLVNQGMITGSSRLAYRFRENKNIFVSLNKCEGFCAKWLMENRFDEWADKLSGEERNSENVNQLVWKLINDRLNVKDFFDPVHVDVNIVDGVSLDVEAFKNWKTDYKNSDFIYEDDGSFICGTEIEKMSKSKYNTVNPDDLVLKYGADTFRMYEMFLGPVEQSKPWDTKGIEGVHRFLKKLWRLFYNENGPVFTKEEPTNAEYKILHRTIKKVNHDTETFSFNTAVSSFMVCVNELTEVKCHKIKILKELLILLAPYCPHVAEELWHASGNPGFVIDADYPETNENYLKETSFNYPVSINGKLRTNIEMPLDFENAEIENEVLKNETVQKWIDGKAVKKFIIIKGKMINVVV